MEQVGPRTERQRPSHRTSEAAAEISATKLGAYLRKLREGYGYTLRRVEEHSNAYGEAIDNSQLSRFEKGKAVPSFEKLRALARVFNVPIQSFSDVLDLEEYASLEPATADFDELLRIGADCAARGETGRAYAAYERAVRCAEQAESEVLRAERMAEARWRMACALKSLGKLFMTEQELRGLLRERERLAPRSRLRALLQLAYLYREMGDLYLASVLARECLALAEELEDSAVRAGVLNTLGNISHDQGELEQAAEHYRQSLAVLDNLQGHEEMRVTVLTNLGGCFVKQGRHDEGTTTLRSAQVRASQNNFRRALALATTRLAEAWIARKDHAKARQLLAESDASAARPEGSFHDILFSNAFHRWRMVQAEGNRTGERLAFGRLRHLRSLLQRRFPEVDEFDRHVERIRR